MFPTWTGEIRALAMVPRKGLAQNKRINARFAIFSIFNIVTIGIPLTKLLFLRSQKNASLSLSCEARAKAQSEPGEFEDNDPI
jgi:hypothetical protein